MLKKENEGAERLFEAVLALQTVDECAAFFGDICTIQELKALSQRLEVARLLLCEKNYADINRATGVSTATICRVSRAINYGDGGYKTVLERLPNN